MQRWVFDLDGTLVDSLSVHFKIMEKVFNKFNLQFTNDDCSDVLKINARTISNYFELRFGKQNTGEALDLFHQLSDEAVETIRPFDGVEDLLKTLQSHNKQLAIWTARDFNSMTRILNATGLSSYFSISVSGNCTSQAKPHPEGLRKIAEHFDSNNTSMIMVGDFDSDMIGAKNFGIHAVRVLWHPLAEQKKCELANWQFNKVEEFKNWAIQLKEI